MDTAQAFRFGFLARCAEEGLAPDQALARAKSALALVKQANGAGLAGRALGMLGPALTGAKDTAMTVFPWIVGGGAVTAAMLGAAAAKAQDADFDPSEAKRQELIDTLNFHTDQLRRRQLLRTAHQPVIPHARRRA